MTVTGRAAPSGGQVDSTSNSEVAAPVQAVAVPPDGKVFIGGEIDASSTTIQSGSAMSVGDGVQTAVYQLLGGSVATGCGLVFAGRVTNNGIIHVQNGSVIEADGSFVNNSILDLMGGTTNFLSTFMNNGTIVTSADFRILSITQEGNNMRISWPAVGGRSYVVQVADDLDAGFADLSSTIDIPGTSLSITNYLDLGGRTNTPSRFYRVRLAP